MILINGNWESVTDISDIVRIASEYIGEEFAKEVEEICKRMANEIDVLSREVEELEDQIDENDDAENELDCMKDEIKMLKKRIDGDPGIADDIKEALDLITR